MLRRSKTYQKGKGKVVHVFPIGGSDLCPIKVMQEFLDVRPTLGGSFLLHEDGTPLSRYQFVTVFRRCMGALGLVAKEFSAHSFRIGAATEAARSGLDDEMVKRIGRWESRRFRLYVKPHLMVNLGENGSTGHEGGPGRA